MEYIIVAVLVFFSGIFSGLTIGMFSLNVSDLKRKIKLGNKDAQRVLKIRENGYLLLCTLLLGNVAVNSAMAILLGSIASGLIAGIISTALIVIFGEIIPQAIFTRFALKFGSRFVWIVRIFIFLTFPVSAPLAWVLTKLLGTEQPTIWKKQEIKEIIKEHEDSPASLIDKEEERILLGALSFSDKTAKQVMTPRSVTCSLNADYVIEASICNEIKAKGFTRIPVYENTIDNVIGLLFVKDLIGLDFQKETTIGELCNREKKLFIQETIKLDILLNRFIMDKIHMAIVFDEYGNFIGIVTLEDVIEEIINVEIVDEADKIINMQKLAKEMYAKKYGNDARRPLKRQ
jgi:metal transporter CNNM